MGPLHCGRTLVPLLHLVIHTGEVGFTMQQATQDHITPQMGKIYRHSPIMLVSILWQHNWATTWTHITCSSVQLCILAPVEEPLECSVGPPLIGWKYTNIARFWSPWWHTLPYLLVKQCMSLHSLQTICTLLWIRWVSCVLDALLLNALNTPQVVSQCLGVEAFSLAIVQNLDMKGIISLTCGYTYQYQKSFESYKNLIKKWAIL